MSERQTSTRLMMQMVANVFICGRAQKIIAKQNLRGDTIPKMSYLYFVVFIVVLVGLNQAIFFYFKDSNLYEQLGIPRRLSLSQIKEHVQKAKVEIMLKEDIVLETRIQMVKDLEGKSGVLTHPARRLSYDSFGHEEVEYAWAFKSPQFILSTIIGSSVFYVISTIMATLQKDKSEMKEAFKVEIVVMILLFCWELDLIVTAEAQLGGFRYDLLDDFYFAFTLFERREMMKIILFPSMSLVEIFIRYYTISRSERLSLLIGNQPQLLSQTLPVRNNMESIKMDQHIEDRVNVALEQSKRKEPMSADIFMLQRELLKKVFFLEANNIMDRNNVKKMLKYFKLK